MRRPQDALISQAYYAELLQRKLPLLPEDAKSEAQHFAKAALIR